ELVIGGAEDGLVGRTPGAFHVWSAGPQTFGPMSVPQAFPQMPQAVCKECQKAARAARAATGSPALR
ncbi:hypothetical protein, partial [Paraherbaspirillum soli]